MHEPADVGRPQRPGPRGPTAGAHDVARQCLAACARECRVPAKIPSSPVELRFSRDF
jgi:hypothetical protein